MGKLEFELKKEVKKEKVQKAILYSIAAAGVLSVALLAPNALQMLAMFDNQPKKKGRRYNLKRSLDRLLYNDLVVFEEKADRKFLRLTDAGKRKLELIKINDFKIARPNKWDKKWRVIIFDIKEIKRSARSRLRKTLQSIGFVKLQNSVWLYPYDCEDLITLLKLDLKMGKDVIYMIVDKIENDKIFREIFGLPKK